MFNNLILVGDSAGQANPLVLEGIRYLKLKNLSREKNNTTIKNKKTDWSRAGNQIDIIRIALDDKN